MKLLIKIVLILLALIGCHGSERSMFEKALKSLKQLRIVDGSAVGYGAYEGDFYNLTRIIIQTGSSDDFIKMLKSESDITRIMGVYCLTLIDKNKYQKDILPIFNDSNKIYFNPSGCIIWTETVGGVAKQIYDNFKILGPFPKKLFFQSIRTEPIQNIFWNKNETSF